MKQILIFALLSLITQLHAQTSEVFTTDEGAIRGYDPVGYFKNGEATKGRQEFSFTYKGAVWHFSSEENMREFKSNPEMYAPQFGGYCAFGASDGDGHKAPTQPDSWTIVGGKLYFNYNKKVREMWLTDTTSRIRQAKVNWPKIKDQ